MNIGVVAACLLLMLTPAMAQTVCLTADDREKARALMLEGLDSAVKQQTITLFENRLRDREPSPERIQRGMRNTVIAYVRSREQVLKWSPPTCEVPR